MKIFKIISLIILLNICLVFMTGCYSSKGLETLAYVVAIGLDKGEDNDLRLSLQIAILNNSSGSGGGSGSSQSTESTIETVDCSSIDSGINLINGYISKKINLSHCKAIIFSEELATEGISEFLYTLVNNLEIRPDCNVIVSRCDASNLLENSSPTLESISARYYELILNSSEYTGYSENLTLKDFYFDTLSSTSQAHAILGGINTKSTHLSNQDMPLYDIEGSYKADDTPFQKPIGIENMGLAVFKGDKLVGELDGSETLCHLLVTDKLDSSIITIPNPFNENSVISIYIFPSKNSKISVSFVNNTPFIECEFSIVGNILSMDENLDYTDSKNLQAIEECCNSYLEQNALSFLYKTAKEYNSDICNFGIYALNKYTTWDEWNKSDWLANYENSFFKVKINTTIQSAQLFTKL